MWRSSESDRCSWRSDTGRVFKGDLLCCSSFPLSFSLLWSFQCLYGLGTVLDTPDGEPLSHRTHYSQLPETPRWNSSPVLCYMMTSSPNTVLPARLPARLARPPRTQRAHQYKPAAPVRSGPLWSAPVHSGPLWSAPVRSGPLRSAPVQLVKEDACSAGLSGSDSGSNIVRTDPAV